MNKNNIKLYALALTGTLISFTLSGCSYQELAPEEEYSVLNQNQEGSGLLNSGLTKTLDIPGESFKLVTQYTCDGAIKRQWRVTADKFLYFRVNTEGLPDDTQVYIDNIHIDVSIKSKFAQMDGIIQDTMDDRVHNAQMIGFPIGNNVDYYGVFSIEGCNQDFIKGTFYGYNGYSSGSIEEKRYSEGDYREFRVTDNKFQFVYDLLIKGPNDKDFRNVSVNTDFVVPISKEPIEFLGSDGKIYVLEGTEKVLKKDTK